MDRRRLSAIRWYSGGSEALPFESEYQAILDRGTALGYILPSAGQQVKQNALVLALKNAGIWALLDIFYVYANDGSGAFGTLNWKSSSFQATLVNTPSFTLNQGYNSNGTSSYLNLNWNPNDNGVNFTVNSASMGSFMYTGGAGGCIIGAVAGVSYATIFDNGTITARFNSAATNTDYTGHLVYNDQSMYSVVRTGATALEVFVNGVSVNTGVTAANARPDGPLFSLARSITGSADLWTPSALKKSCDFAGGAISQADIYTAFNNYMISL